MGTVKQIASSLRGENGKHTSAAGCEPSRLPDISSLAALAVQMTHGHHRAHSIAGGLACCPSSAGYSSAVGCSTVLTKNPGSVPSTYSVQLTTTRNSSCRDCCHPHLASTGIYTRVAHIQISRHLSTRAEVTGHGGVRITSAFFCSTAGTLGPSKLGTHIF